METKHTPGPWTYVRKSDEWIAITSEPEFDCGFIDVWGHIIEGSDVEANARLVAAAPELLDALIICESVLRITGYQNAAEKARAAITKATGV